MADFSLVFADGADAYTIPYVQSFRDNFGDAVTDTDRLPGLSGGFDNFGVEDAGSEIGRVDVTLMLAADTREAMQALIDTVKKLRNLGRRKLYFQPQGTAAQRWCYARVNNVSVARRPADQTDLIQPVSIIFQVADPHWMETEENAVINASGVSTSGTITNDGNADALARVVIACTGVQTIENPTIRRLVNSVVIDEMIYTGVLTAGDTLIMDAQKKSVTLNGVGVYDSFDYEHPDWLRLKPGANSIYVIAANAGDAAAVTVYFSNTYR